MGYFTKPPCYNNGMDCPKRQVGCREKCDDWQKWQIIHAKEKEQQYAIYVKERDVNDFEALQNNRIRHLDRARKAQEKRRH